LRKIAMDTARLNFSWVVDGVIAGHGAPLDDEDLNYLRGKGIRALIRLVEAYETRLIAGQISRFGFIDLHEPIPDLAAPQKNQIEKVLAFITRSLADGRPIAVSCNAGLGRTGTILACYLVSKGFDANAAINEVRIKRPGSIVTSEQEEAVRIYAGNLKITQNERIIS
jgi:atypical dual specificity phosphatase